MIAMSIEAVYALLMTAVALVCIVGVALWEWWDVYRCQRCRTCGHPRYQHTGLPTPRSLHLLLRRQFRAMNRPPTEPAPPDECPRCRGPVIDISTSIEPRWHCDRCRLDVPPKANVRIVNREP